MLSHQSTPSLGCALKGGHDGSATEAVPQRSWNAGFGVRIGVKFALCHLTLGRPRSLSESWLPHPGKRAFGEEDTKVARNLVESVRRGAGTRATSAVGRGAVGSTRPFTLQSHCGGPTATRPRCPPRSTPEGRQRGAGEGAAPFAGPEVGGVRKGGWEGSSVPVGFPGPARGSGRTRGWGSAVLLR